jgi:hypothetical protein
MSAFFPRSILAALIDIDCRLPRIRKRDGRCYELSYAGQLQAPSWILVHGYVAHAHGVECGHAWLERDGLVYDAVLDELMPASVYKADVCATELKRYTFVKAASEMLRTGHSGPWHDGPDVQKGGRASAALSAGMAS